MDQPTQNSPEVKPAPAGTSETTEPVRRAWSLDTVPPAPSDMPSDRLKARAELVRAALYCGTY